MPADRKASLRGDVVLNMERPPESSTAGPTPNRHSSILSGVLLPPHRHSTSDAAPQTARVAAASASPPPPLVDPDGLESMKRAFRNNRTETTDVDCVTFITELASTLYGLNMPTFFIQEARLGCGSFRSVRVVLLLTTV